MKTIQLHLYDFAELDEKAKAVAIEADRYINVDFNWWEFIYDDFIAICKTIGITIEKENIFFSGFYSQGDGSGFTAAIDLPVLWDAIGKHNWKSYEPDLELDLHLPELDRRVVKLIRANTIDATPKITHPHRAYYVKAELNENLPNRYHGYPLIEKQLDVLENGLIKIAETLNRYLYESLQTDFEYQTQDQAITEAIEANEYWFTADGKKATRLDSLAFKNSMQTL
jgi:hypothetical protein